MDITPIVFALSMAALSPTANSGLLAVARSNSMM
jgi:hypothetical protein